MQMQELYRNTKGIFERHKMCPKLKGSYSIFIDGKAHCLKDIPLLVEILVFVEVDTFLKKFI